MTSLLPKLTDVEKTIILMILHLVCPEIREECRRVSEIPLSGFTTLSRIREYTQNIVEYGVSNQVRGRIFLVGNTGVGKTSLAHTLKQFTEKSENSECEGAEINAELEGTV